MDYPQAGASIGKIGTPYYDEINDRTKAFITNPQTSESSIRKTLIEILREANGARIAVRLIISRNLSCSNVKEIMVTHDGRKMICEAVIPCNHPEISCIAYFGWNQDIRTTSPETLNQERSLLANIQKRSQQTVNTLQGGKK